MTMTKRIEYVTGFLFDKTLSKVLLIQKTKPEWQKGKCNGVGGKVEKSETFDNAMQREFKEETGLEVESWHDFGTILHPTAVIELYCAVADLDFVKKFKQTTEEAPVLVDVMDILLNKVSIVPNVRWAIPLAMNALENAEENHKHFTIHIEKEEEWSKKLECSNGCGC